MIGIDVKKEDKLAKARERWILEMLLAADGVVARRPQPPTPR